LGKRERGIGERVEGVAIMKHERMIENRMSRRQRKGE
jgi:hypothetical protein